MENGDARLQIFPPSFFLSFFDITCVLAVFDNFKKKKGKKRGGGGGVGHVCSCVPCVPYVRFVSNVGTISKMPCPYFPVYMRKSNEESVDHLTTMSYCFQAEIYDLHLDWYSLGNAKDWLSF